MLGLTFYSKLVWGSNIISITAKAASKKIGTLNSSEISFSWGTPSCSLELLDKLEKWICRAVGPSFAASLELLTHRQDVANLNLFYRYCFGRCLSELAKLVPLSYSGGRSTRYSDWLHHFSVTIHRCYKGVYVNRFFLHTAKLWNSLATECFPLTFDLSSFKSRTNRHLLTVGSL